MRIWRKRVTDLMNQSISHEAVYRTAPAKPGLLNTARQISVWVVGTLKDQLCHLLHHIQDKDQLSGAHEEGAHLLARGPAGVKAGLWGKSCCCWMRPVWGYKAQERERVHFCNVCDKALKSLQVPSQHIIWLHSDQWPVASGHLFACNGCCKKFNPINSINKDNKLVRGKPPTGRVFVTSSCGARNNIEEIILNLNLRGVGEEEDGSGQFQEEGRHPLLCWFLINLYV